MPARPSPRNIEPVPSADPRRLVALGIVLLALVAAAAVPHLVEAQAGPVPIADIAAFQAGEGETPEATTTSPPEASAPDAVAARGAHPAAPDGTPKVIQIPHAWMQWLRQVDVLITAPERRLFLTLDQEYERQAFEREFWKVRDPYPRTVRNELKERWPRRLAEVNNRFADLDDARSRIYLVHGEPAARLPVKCTQTHVPAEVWFYRGTDWTDVHTALVFVRTRNGRGPAELWRPFGATGANEALLSRIRGCVNGSQMMQVVSVLRTNVSDYARQVEQLTRKPRPSSTEWVHTFVAYSTDLEPGSQPMEASLEVLFPGRHQLRTVVQGLIRVPRTASVVGEYGGYRSHDFRLTGEVVTDRGTADESLLDTFRYQFAFPADDAPDKLPVSFQRYLRPGDYTLVLKLDDLNSNRAWRREAAITVPTSDVVMDIPTFTDPETEALFAEVAAAVAAGEDGIRIVPPEENLLTGLTRFDTLVAGDRVRKVRFTVDDKPVLTKNRPPYSVEIDLGSFPDLHDLRVEAYDEAGALIAEDQLLVNSGGYRFLVRLREPKKGQTYRRSLRARAEVEVPEGRSLERVEFFLNEQKVATLYQEPFVQPIALPETADVAYVRAVAHLADGNSTEDLVFINAPDYIDEVEIQFVELYTSVVDGDGRPVTGLERDAFRVLEDGQPQTIARFERVEDLPIHVGVLIDSSASMVGTLDEVKRAALGFFEQAIGPRDRAAVIPFNTFPRLAVELTSDQAALGSGLAGLAPEGKTALYDSVMFALYYFAGVKGQRAVLVLSDGRDESSRFSFDDTLEYARRAGITIYTIGMRLGDPGARSRLARLAHETGGTSYFLHDIEGLGPVYAAIQQELRSQLLIAYQSTNTSDDGAFRRVELEVDRPGLTVKTLSGYYP